MVRFVSILLLSWNYLNYAVLLPFIVVALLLRFVLCLFRFKLEMNEHKCVMTISQQQRQKQQVVYAILEQAK